jgi:presequence protease
LLCVQGAYINLTADSDLLGVARPYADALLAELPDKPPKSLVGGDPWSQMLPRANEAILVPTQVNYVAKAANLYDAGYELHGSVFVIEKQLGMTHIWDRVRVMGGAYGGFCSFDPLTGQFSFASYR